jgi:hypothetical protein
VSPKVIEKKKRYLLGRIWVDSTDLQIVVTNGRMVPDDTRKGSEDLHPPFMTWRQQVDGHYWFPVYTKGEGVLHFSGGSATWPRTCTSATPSNTPTTSASARPARSSTRAKPSPTTTRSPTPNPQPRDDRSSSPGWSPAVVRVSDPRPHLAEGESLRSTGGLDMPPINFNRGHALKGHSFSRAAERQSSQWALAPEGTLLINPSLNVAFFLSLLKLDTLQRDPPFQPHSSASHCSRPSGAVYVSPALKCWETGVKTRPPVP